MGDPPAIIKSLAMGRTEYQHLRNTNLLREKQKENTNEHKILYIIGDQWWTDKLIYTSQ